MSVFGKLKVPAALLCLLAIVISGCAGQGSAASPAHADSVSCDISPELRDRLDALASLGRIPATAAYTLFKDGCEEAAKEHFPQEKVGQLGFDRAKKWVAWALANGGVNPIHRGPVFGATGDNPAGWTINTGTGHLVSPSKKITGLANATASGDAVHFGQTVTTATNGLALATDKALWAFLTTTPAGAANLEFDDFISAGENSSGAAAITMAHTFGRLQWRASFSGTGAAVTFVTTSQDSSHWGILQLDRGTTTTGTCAIARFPASTPHVVLGSGQTLTHEWGFRIPNLSDGTNTYVAHVGYMDTAVAAPANEVAIEYSSGSPSSGNFICRACNATSCSTGTGGSTVTAAANTWYRGTVTWDGTNACCFVSGTNVGCIAGATIPTAPIGEIAHITGSAGTASRTILLDYYWNLPTRSSAPIP